MKILIIPVSRDDYLQNSASERFRCNWLLPYLKADKSTGNENSSKYDVIIYQKAYLSKNIINTAKKNQKKIQIFDVTDPEWLFRPEKFKNMISLVDAVVASTPALVNEINPKQIIQQIKNIDLKLNLQPKSFFPINYSVLKF
jgi:hypothetical protein